MAMKQTQTKLFDFSDVGLDFCAGSKNLFPDRFKKMLSLGYNVQTVTSVAVVGNQVTFTYGGTHGYAADRVLKVDSGALASINGGEFWIDSVTTNTVTFTLDNIPSSIANGFSTRIASLGWALEYESGQVQLYKMKYLDERDLYVRLVFPVAGNTRAAINVCIGKTADISTGVITDPNSIETGRSNTSITNGFEWALGYQATTTYQNYNYAQGLSQFGLGCLVGSKYHVCIMGNNGHAGNYAGFVFGIFPTSLYKYEKLDYPLLLGAYNTAAITSGGVVQQLDTLTTFSQAYIGLVAIAMGPSSSSIQITDTSNSRVVTSFFTDEIEGFNTGSAYPLSIYEKSTKQFLGFVSAGLYRYDPNYSNSPPNTRATSPSTITDIDLNNIIKMHAANTGSALTSAVWFCVPVEEVKIVS
ncbi:hypothetical protein [Acinetobacter pseudolwoffii]|uniref:hypothetical protein n=1 Tax=Acinetobacter pseudolwoffii TaxID=2053287 RepID=UPI00209B3050|nr:hypothetical protein [Acinetobacter pseudolwoffii]MCO8092082.1 hypothetical protein [Acinetobacter pseudolwoffii]